MFTQSRVAWGTAGLDLGVTVPSTRAVKLGDLAIGTPALGDTADCELGTATRPALGDTTDCELGTATRGAVGDVSKADMSSRTLAASFARSPCIVMEDSCSQSFARAWHNSTPPAESRLQQQASTYHVRVSRISKGPPDCLQVFRYP